MYIKNSDKNKLNGIKSNKIKKYTIKDAKMVCLDIMSRRNQIKEIWTAFGHNVQTDACK